MRERVFRFLAGAIAVLFVAGKVVQPPQLENLHFEVGQATLVALFAAYAWRGNQLWQPCQPAEAEVPQ